MSPSDVRRVHTAREGGRQSLDFIQVSTAFPETCVQFDERWGEVDSLMSAWEREWGVGEKSSLTGHFYDNWGVIIGGQFKICGARRDSEDGYEHELPLPTTWLLTSLYHPLPLPSFESHVLRKAPSTFHRPSSIMALNKRFINALPLFFRLSSRTVGLLKGWTMMAAEVNLVPDRESSLRQ
ncbi:hypothetical protein BgiBS90_013964 [Biomphalaria glabrata]|nr:hypothetical protein BgiBS90_013964 [Biomphalaria glabrata]